MKNNLIFFLMFHFGATIVATGCSKKDSSSLPDECQSMFAKWDAYIKQLSVDSNVPGYFVKANEETRALELQTILRLKKSEQISECNVYNRVVDRQIHNYESDPQQLYKDILNSDAANKARNQ